MRHTPRYLMTDPEEVRRLVRAAPVGHVRLPGLDRARRVPLPGARGGGTATSITLVSHFGRPDETLHELGQHEILVIVQGPHDYVSPSWYPPGELVPTWNHVTAHLYGTPEILSDDENYAMLALLTDHFEHDRPGGRRLDEDEAAPAASRRGPSGSACASPGSTPGPSSARTSSPPSPRTSSPTSSPPTPPSPHEMRRVHPA